MAKTRSSFQPKAWGRRLFTGLAGFLIRMFLVGLGSTYRVHRIGGEDVLENLVEEPGSRLLVFWHNRAPVCAYFLYRRLLRRGFQLTLLASPSQDGDLIVGLAKAWGLDLVRGSSSRGGKAALWALYGAIQEGSSPLIVPDGPRGPAYEPKNGVVYLGQMSGKPVIPMGFAAESYWRIGSWDRMIFPKPFSRIAVDFGEPVYVEKKGDVPEERRKVKEALDAATARACESLGQEFPED